MLCLIHAGNAGHLFPLQIETIVKLIIMLMFRHVFVSINLQAASLNAV